MIDPDPPPGAICIDGMLVPWDQAVVHTSSEAFLRGLSVFEGVRAYWTGEHFNVIDLARHHQRLERACKILRIEPGFDFGELVSAVTRSIAAVGQMQDLYVRITVIVGAGSYEPAAADSVSWHVAAFPRPRTAPVLTCCVSSWQRPSDLAYSPLLKVGGAYTSFRLPRMEARDRGFDEVLLLNDQGRVAETPGASVFVKRGNAIATPDLSSGILAGITRSAILRLLRARDGIEVVERPIARTELYFADEVFIAGTLDEVRAVRRIDHIELLTEFGVTIREEYYRQCVAAPEDALAVTAIPIRA